MSHSAPAFPADLQALRIEEGSEKGWQAVKVTDGRSNWYIRNLSPQAAAMSLSAAKAVADLGTDAMTHIARAQEIEWENLPEVVKSRVHGEYGNQMFLLEAVPNKAGFFQLSDQAPPEEMQAALQGFLRGQPVTGKEQEQIIREWQILNDQNIFNYDLGSNAAFLRGPSGKLTLYVWDFDANPTQSQGDVAAIKGFFKGMQRAGTAESFDLEYKPPGGGKGVLHR